MKDTESDGPDDDSNEDDDDDGIRDLLHDVSSFFNDCPIEKNLGASTNASHSGTDVFNDLLMEATEELYPGCTKFLKLSFIIKLLHWKVYNKWSNKYFDMLLSLLRDVLPNGQSLPKSYYAANCFLQNLGLGYVPIHACKYDCALFWKEYENCDSCPKCGTSRWMINNGKDKKIPYKVLRYFMLKFRLQ
ncbi:uncharacterized protein [Elaeis guineensis]|uniref:Uncharacterized protein LOC109505474 n=1 Tax=Elaeis guineensis var. tenera TaxID=51953 RepID=A0A8N4F198_ELAGV|nr:uncharacterized protein LOC109505474 [Elaeis guineensis]